jgi:hypothetical protein
VAFLPIIRKEPKSLIQIPPGVIPITVTVTIESAPVEEVIAIEPEPVQEIVSIEHAPTQEVVVEEYKSTDESIVEEPQPTEEIVAVEPEPTKEVAVEVTSEETISGDIESTDSNQEGTLIYVLVSHYNPGLGGVNCARFANGECLSKMSNGERWQDYWGEYNTIACPFELPFGTVIRLDGNDFTCRDRGGAIVITYEGYYWIDILAERVPYSYGELREAYIIP